MDGTGHDPMPGDAGAAPATRPRAETDRELAALVARRFYLEDETKVAIADELHISRFKVARLLEFARSSGIVNISLHDGGVADERLADRLRDHLGLRECVVVSSDGSAADVRRQVGAAAADLLGSTLRAGDVLGLAWGRTLSALTAQLQELPPVTIVQLTGAAGGDLSESPIEVVRRASLRSGGKAYAYYLPLLVRDATTAASLRQNPDVGAAMRMFDEITVAVVAIGSWDPPVSQFHDLVTDAERQRLLDSHVRADIAGILLDRDGSTVDEGFIGRTLSVRTEQLGRVPRVVAAAAGADKAVAVLAAARSGLISGLVTDRAFADAALELPPVPS